MTHLSSTKPGLQRLAILLAAAAAFAGTQAQAASITELGDAGQTVVTAQDTTSVGPVQSISDITGSLLSSQDADLFVIHIVNPGSFSASTDNAQTVLFDTQLFLLTMSGAPVALNDDAASGLTALSTLSGVNSLAAGYYILGVSLSGYDPVNSVNQTLFAQGLSTTIRYGATGLQPAVLGGFFDSTYYTDSGAYRITLNGVDSLAAVVPEPASALLLALGACGLAALRRRRVAE